MQYLQDLKDKIFFESQNIIESLEKISTVDELLLKQDLVEELSDRITFLKLLEKNKDYFIEKRNPESQDNFLDVSDIEELNYEVTEEEAIFNNELNEIETSNQMEVYLDKDETESKSDDIQKEKTENLINKVEIKENEILIDEPNSEISNNSEEIKTTEEVHPTLNENKIKLANIKGLKPQTEEIISDKIVVSEEQSGSLLKTNIPLDYMEEQKLKPKPEFKLDLNDRIAFSKMLFNGSQSELNEVVHNLNNFGNIEQAKEYLSELYYDKNWKKVDEYAQRLWTLVENKFL